MALSYDVCVFILYNHPGFLLATEQGSPYRDFAEIVKKMHGLHAIIRLSSSDICSKIARCPCDVNAGSLLLSQEPTIIFGPKLLSKLLWCPHDQRAVPVRGSCNQPTMCLRATDLRFFKICQSA